MKKRMKELFRNRALHAGWDNHSILLCLKYSLL